VSARSLAAARGRALALAVLVTASACSSRPPAPPAHTAPASATANQINAQARDRLRDGGTVTLPIYQLPTNWNFFEIDGNYQSAWYVLNALLPSTFKIDATGTPHWNPDYLVAEPVLSLTPASAQTVTYEINPKAFWSDGTPITWQDFYWQWKANAGVDHAYQIAGSNGYEDIANVTKGRSDREVIVTFKHLFADWQYNFNQLYPASTNKSPAAFNEGWKNHIGLSAGPFRLDRLDQTAATVVLVRDDRWWGERAKLDRLVFRAIESDAHADALANGEIDAMPIAADADKFRRASTMTGIDMRSAGGPSFEHLDFNGTSPMLSDVRVRRALAMGIDRAAIARALLGPLGLTPAPLGNHIFMANQVGYQDNSGDVGRYDPDGAGRLLDQAGWTLTNGVRRKEGRTLEVSFVIRSGEASFRRESELVQNMLGRIGVTVRINAVPNRDFFDSYVTPGQFDLTVFSWFGTAFPISTSKPIYAMPQRSPNGQLDVQENYSRIGSAEIDRLFDEGIQELDRSKANAIANQVDALIWQEAHSLSLYQRPDLWACRQGLANFGAIGFADLTYQDIGWVK